MACLALKLPTRKALALSWPCVVSAGQRPLTDALALTLPLNEFALAVDAKRHSGASACKLGAATFKFQASRAFLFLSPSSIAARLPDAVKLLPAASSLMSAFSMPLGSVSKFTSPCSGTPANRLRATNNLA